MRAELAGRSGSNSKKCSVVTPGGGKDRLGVNRRGRLSDWAWPDTNAGAGETDIGVAEAEVNC